MVTFDVLTATVHVFSTPHHSTLPQTLREMDLTTLRPFAPGEPQNFAKFLDKVVGLVWSLSDFELWVNFFNRTICAGPSNSDVWEANICSIMGVRKFFRNDYDVLIVMQCCRVFDTLFVLKYEKCIIKYYFLIFVLLLMYNFRWQC